MKRPNGFDREPRSPEPDEATPEPRDSERRESAFRMPERRRSDHSEPEPEPEFGSDRVGAGASAPVSPSPVSAVPVSPIPDERREADAAGSQHEAGETGIAPTVDLGEVRAQRSAGVLGRLRGGEREVRGGALAAFRDERAPDPVAAAERRLRAAEKERRAQERRERRRFSAEARKRRRTWWVALGTVGALALFVAVGVFTPLMSVRSIELVGAEQVDEPAVRKALARFDGVPIALVRDADVHRALEPFPRIQSYATEIVPPSTLVVRIVERVPVVAVAEGKSFRLYDAAGVLLSTADALPENVPVASGKVADLSSEPFAAASRALRDMPADLRSQIVAVTASSGQNVEFQLRSGIDVLWGDAENSKRKSIVLQSMLGSEALTGRKVERIDVSSFEAPVFN